MGEAQEQRCGRCKETLPLDNFSPSYRGKPGTWCRSCFAAYTRGDRSTSVPNPARECEQCGKSYVPRQLKSNAKFCSRTCKDRSLVGTRAGRTKWLTTKYGINADEYDVMFAEQDGKCAICGTEQAAGRYGVFHVDHCHKTGRLRGLLCSSCNHGLGQFRDDPAVMRLAAEYVERC
jgi:hypothetical protein